METRGQHWTRMVPVVAFVVASVVIATLVWRSFGGSTPLSPTGYRVEIPLPHASNLFPGADVRIAGVTVGDVVEVEREREGARATMELESEYAPLRSDARVILRTKTLLGEAYLEMTAGSRDAEPVPEGGELAASRVQPAQRLDDVLQTFAPGTREHLRGALSGLARAFADRQESLSNSLGRLAPVSADLGAVVGQLDAQRSDLRELIASAADVFGALGARQGAMRAAIRSGNRLLDVTADRDRALAATVRALPPFLTELRHSSELLGASSGDLSRAVEALAPAVPPLRPALRRIEATAPDIRRLFDDLPGVIKSGNRGLPSLSRMLEAAGPPLQQVYPAARDVVPVLEQFATIRDSLITTLANVAQLHNGTYVGPGNRILNYANGIINVWNESISGWVKRLPTNRGNTYPKPGFLRGIAEHGVLDSYDCRHLDNPLYLPPFGAAPPCREQGPWTYEGRTAYFPRLKRAGP